MASDGLREEHWSPWPRGKQASGDAAGEPVFFIWECETLCILATCATRTPTCPIVGESAF